MANERLRDALQSEGVTPGELAGELNVDPKTVERWITKERAPYRKHRHAVAARLGEQERYLWPGAVSDSQAQKISQSEIVQVYPHRTAVPTPLWGRLLDHATTYVDILVHAGGLLTEQQNLVTTLRTKAGEGTRVRLLFGQRDSAAVIQRGLDEGGDRTTLPAEVDDTLAHFEPLADVTGIEVRTHDTVLYNSIYRFDDVMLVNPHVYGKPAAHAPVMHLRRLSAGDLFTTYADSFDAVWDTARPHSR